MSGHSKWSTIKRAKAVTDAKRGQLFSKITRAITLAAKQGGPDFNANVRLRILIDQARSANMPKENIERAIDKATGAGNGGLEEVVYEGYGPGGVAILVEAATDNKNRTTQEVKSIFDRSGGSLGTPGSVVYQFEQRGLIVIEKGADSDDTMLKLIDLGAEDVEAVEDGIEVYTKPGDLFKTKEMIEQVGMVVKSAELMFSPKTPLALTDSDKEQKVLKLIEALDEHEDVQKVYANLT